MQKPDKPTVHGNALFAHLQQVCATTKAPKGEVVAILAEILAFQLAQIEPIYRASDCEDTLDYVEDRVWQMAEVADVKFLMN